MSRLRGCADALGADDLRQLLDGASELFTRGKKTKDKEEGQAKEAELFQQIGKLQMELEWLKKKSQLL